MESKKDIRLYLERKLHEVHAFWSFDKGSCHDLSDHTLIKYVLIHLDLDDIQWLFHLYPKKIIKRVWLDELIPQGDYYISMNLAFALLLFDIKRPLPYVKSMQTRHFHKLAAHYG